MDPNIKTYLGKRGYILVKKYFANSLIENIKKELRVKPFVNSDYGAEPEEFNVYLENEHKLYIPKFYGLAKFGKPDIDRLPNGLDANLKFEGQLRQNQIEPVNVCLKALTQKGGGILSLRCGSGKTALSLYLATQLGKKTLVIVHKEFLVNQWKERIQQFLPTARIGVIQQEKIDVDDKDIVIGMLQSISMKAYALDTFDSFATVIIDECHRIPCKVFSKALQKINSHYMLGLSATPNRKDGLTKVLKWYIGDIVFSDKSVDVNVIHVERLLIESDNKYYNTELNTYRGKPNMPKMINNICENLNRTKLIIQWMQDLVEEERKILVLSDRRNHLEDIYKLIKKDDICSVGFYMGGMKQKDLKESESKTILLGTFSMSAEGLDVPGLDTLILASPKSDIVQAVGRILRKKHDIIQPRILDLVDQFSLFEGQSQKRLKYYKQKGYEIDNIEIKDTGEILNTYRINYNFKQQTANEPKKVEEDKFKNQFCFSTFS